MFVLRLAIKAADPNSFKTNFIIFILTMQFIIINYVDTGLKVKKIKTLISRVVTFYPLLYCAVQ